MQLLSLPPAPLPSSSTRPNHHHHQSLLPYLYHCSSIAHLKQVYALSLRISADSSPTQLWTVLLRAVSRCPLRRPLTFPLLRSMLLSFSPLDSSSLDSHSFPLVLTACAHLSALPHGSQLHSLLTKLGLSYDLYIANSLVHFYSSCGRLDLARQLFDRMRFRSRVSWNVMIDGYVMCGEYDVALLMFREMMAVDGFAPDGYTLQSAICACASLGAVSLGMWAHAFILRKCDDSVARDVLISNSLLDLYSKCGSIDLACRVFDAMPKRDVASWNAIILGLAMNGRTKESLEAFDLMSVENRPNSITFVGVLSACKHGGLVLEGRRYLDMMVSFGIEPQLEHYGCIVDLLARAGLIDEALDIVLDMPFKPDVVIWRSLLDACCKRNAGIKVSETVAMHALESEEVATSGAYVLLSRVYASANRWNDVGLVRKLMTDEGIKKEPGGSLIEVDGVVHEFVAGDTSHPQSGQIYSKLEEVEHRLASIGHKPDSSQAPMVAELENVKSDSLRLHSERLAIAFGLLNMEPGTPIRVLKNLRVCRDCHEITRLVSRLYHVEIVVRDRVRFHHFKDGLCSCKGYW